MLYFKTSITINTVIKPTKFGLIILPAAPLPWRGVRDGIVLKIS